MANEFEAGECGITCVDGGGCIALSNKPQSCSCYCEPSGVIHPFDTPVDVETQIDVDIADMELASFGALMDTNFDGDVMIPAAEARSSVAIQLEGASFGSVCQEVGLEYRTR